MSIPFLRLWLAGALALTLGFAAPLASTSLFAQDDGAAYDVAIFQGTCEEPAAAASFTLGTTYPYGAGPEDDGDNELRGVTNAMPVWAIDETIDSDFGTLLDDLPHMIAILGAGGTVEDMVACGELGGIVDDGRLVVGLRPMGDAGVAGVAIVDEDETGFLGLGDNEVNVRVFLLTDLATTGGAPPTDEATPPAGPTESPDAEATPTAPGATEPATPTDGDGQAQTEVEVEMVDIDFNPNEFTIPADTDVTIHLPNNGAAVHTFVIDGNNNPSDPGIHSGDVAPGDSTTITINLPAGDWYFYCDIPGHEQAGMFGTVHAVEQ